MLSLIMCMGTWPGPSIMVCTSCFQAILVSSPKVSSSANWASSLASCDGTGTQAVAQGEGHVISLHDFADVFKMGVEEAFLVMGQAPFGHDGTAAADDAGDALGASAGCGAAARRHGW